MRPERMTMLLVPRGQPGVGAPAQQSGCRRPWRTRDHFVWARFPEKKQGLLGAYHLLDWVKEQGYTVGAILDNDIVGADTAPGGPHRVRVFSGNGEIEDCDSPARELARAIEEIAGRSRQFE